MAVRKLNLQEAKDQQAEYFGFESSLVLVLGDDEYEIPHPQLRTAEQLKAFQQAYLKFEECDREEPAPVTVTLKDGSTMKTDPPVGPFIEPRRKGGELMDPPWDVEVCIALWGKAKTDKYIAAGGPPGLVQMTWDRMNDEFERRKKADPK